MTVQGRSQAVSDVGQSGNLVTKKSIVSMAVGLLIGVPAICLIVLLLSNVYNPLTLAFVRTCVIVNQSSQDLWVTPVGIPEGGRTYSLLPRYLDATPPLIPHWRRSNVLVRANSTIAYTYDSDDVTFSHICVTADHNTVYVARVHPNDVQPALGAQGSDLIVLVPLAPMGKQYDTPRLEECQW